MNRDEFVKLGINNPDLAAKLLKSKAMQLSKCRNVTKTAEILSNILFVSDRTIFRDCKK